MSTEAEDQDSQPGESEEEDKGWKIPSFRRLGDFFKRLLELEGTVSSLREENKQMRKELNAVQHQLNEQSGQLRVLAEFVKMATSAQVEATATKSAIKTVESILQVMRNARGERD